MTTDRMVANRYRVLHEIGSGGMGTVWLADDEVLGRLVALKEIVLTRGGEKLAVQRERAIRGARAAARIRHPSVVEIYDVLEEDGTPWIVMDYIQGRTLEELVALGRLGERELAEIGRQVLGALVAAHRVNVLHRDVKPANVVIGDDGRVLLLDFGIAKIGGEGGITSANVLLGTLEYMAPERIEGRELGPPSDLWSLGVTFYLALEGRSPFRRSTMEATMGAIMTQPPPPLSRNGRLSDAVVRLLDKSPARRMAADELGAVLLAVAAARPERHRQSAVRPPHVEPVEPVDERGARRLDGLSHDAVLRTLVQAGPDEAGRILLAQPATRAGSILAAAPPKDAGRWLDRMAVRPPATAAVLGTLLPPSAAAAGRMVSYMTAGPASEVLRAMPTSDAATLLAHVPERVTGAFLDALGTSSVAVRLVEAMTTQRARLVLRHVTPGITAGLLRASTDGRQNRILSLLDDPVQHEVRRILDGT